MNTHLHIKTTLALAVAAMLLGGLTACDTTPKNEGHPKDFRVESRLPSEGSSLGSGNLINATDAAVAGIANVPEIKQAGVRTVIVMDRVDTSKMSDPSANYDIFLARIRASLNQSGAAQDIVFVETRDKAEAIKLREGIPKDQSGRTRPRYALTGTFYDLPRGKTNYYFLSFVLMDLTNDVIAWEGSYEVKL